MKILFRIFLILSVAFAFTACPNKKGRQDPGIDGDSVSGIPLPDRQEGVSYFGDNVDKNAFEPIYFAFDSYAIQSSEQSKLDNVANQLQGNSNTIIIAGFTDERGTPEYNRGLGERRAQSARQYLASRGVDGNRLQTVSFGAEMPADAGHSESAWAKNRRAEFGLVR